MGLSLSIDLTRKRIRSLHMKLSARELPVTFDNFCYWQVTWRRTQALSVQNRRRMSVPVIMVPSAIMVHSMNPSGRLHSNVHYCSFIQYLRSGMRPMSDYGSELTLEDNDSIYSLPNRENLRLRNPV